MVIMLYINRIATAIAYVFLFFGILGEFFDDEEIERALRRCHIYLSAHQILIIGIICLTIKLITEKWKG